MSSSIAPFGYYGGKAKMLDFILEHLPDGNNFLDLFGGSGVVSIAVVGRYNQIVYNDLNSRLVNFFRTLRECPEEVIDQILLTPACREDYDAAWEISPDPIEDARRVFIRINCSFMKQGLWTKSSWQFHGMMPGRSTARLITSRANRLHKVAPFLRYIDIENRDWKKLLRHAVEDTVVFADPPYDLTVRSGGKGYQHEMTENDHRELARALTESPAKAVVCGYRSDLYEELYADWELKEKKMNCNFISIRGKAKGVEKKECLWLKHRTEKKIPTQQSII